MDINEILTLQDKEQAALAEQVNFNCNITISYMGKVCKYDFDDYRIAQAIVNILDNVRFVKSHK